MNNFKYEIKLLIITIFFFNNAIYAKENIVSNKLSKYNAIIKSYKNKKYREVISNSEYFLKKYSKSKLESSVLLIEAKAFYKQRKYHKAYIIFNKLIIKYQNSKNALEAHKWVGYALYHIKKYDDAINEFRKLIKYFPNTEYEKNAVFKIAKCYQKKGKYLESNKIFYKYINKYPESKLVKNALINVGFNYYKLSKFTEAENTLNKVLSNKNIERNERKYVIELLNKIKSIKKYKKRFFILWLTVCLISIIFSISCYVLYKTRKKTYYILLSLGTLLAAIGSMINLFIATHNILFHIINIVIFISFLILFSFAVVKKRNSE